MSPEQSGVIIELETNVGKGFFSFFLSAIWRKIQSTIKSYFATSCSGDISKAQFLPRIKKSSF